MEEAEDDCTVFIITDQLRDYESNDQHMKNQQENVEMELEQFKLQCTQLTNELGKSHFKYFCYLKIRKSQTQIVLYLYDTFM